jgi:hypothetical protein
MGELVQQPHAQEVFKRLVDDAWQRGGDTTGVSLPLFSVSTGASFFRFWRLMGFLSSNLGIHLGILRIHPVQFIPYALT